MRTFDYIVVGAGSAGCALASRLSAGDDGATVALVEAGGPAPAASHVPLDALELFGSEQDWARSTTPQHGLDGRVVDWPSGRMVGGSSAMNFMMWVPGTAHDFDPWVDVAGPRWSWPEVEPYLRAAEDWTGPQPRPPLARGGPMRISPPRDPDPSTFAFLTACHQASLPSGDGGLGSWETSGHGLTPLNQQHGRRWSSVDGHLAHGGRGLTVLDGSTVDSIVLRGQEPAQAQGVRLVDGTVLQARREVVLTAGAVGSPRLLLRSGIGDPVLLRSRGTAPVVPLPGVGRNLHDHLILDLPVPAVRPTRFSRLATPGGREEAVQHFGEGMGALTSNIAEAIAFIRSDGGTGPADLELIWSPMALGPDGFEQGFTVGVVLLQPRSRGSLTTTEIDPRYLTEDSDAAALVAGIEASERLLATPALRDVVGSGGGRPWGTSRASRERFVRETVQTVFHPGGTCRLGLPSDPQAVVDPRLRVFGTTGLRVADMSIAPTPPRGHTHALAVMIGERAAHLVAEDASVSAAEPSGSRLTQDA